ncbi:hypothetical protein [Crocosphaera chwakensis]|uniref:Histidine kinase n=1 Tax=Crocosphaera chwakensis CCY0110 TaxID=391612 RepID=A3IPP3_9CHRO|nr:hypothetical protein [Crocosphaera chwakensis]EAZ91533.1 hypothetical protein CY0110_13471 [Crocosphaera chwakensis CCY0110]
MSSYLKEKITTALEEAKKEEKTSPENVKEIVKSTISQANLEVKEDSQKIRSLVQDIVSAVIENSQNKGEDIKEEMTATVEGIIESISNSKRQNISKNQQEVKQLESKIAQEEKELENNIEMVLNEVNETGKNHSSNIQETIESSIKSIQDSEEFALMKRRYAQLKAKLAVIRANLVSRYSEQFEDVKPYLDEAKSWYQQSQTEPELFNENITEQQKKLETKIEESARTLAQKERHIKQVLRELWQSFSAEKSD